MARNMSFMLTTKQIRNRTKTVTRRLGWWKLKPGEILIACEKCQGLRKGEKVVKLAQLRVISAHEEPLSAITQDECRKEGFPDMLPADFIDMFVRSHRGSHRDGIVNRIEFEYLD